MNLRELAKQSETEFRERIKKYHEKYRKAVKEKTLEEIRKMRELDYIAEFKGYQALIMQKREEKNKKKKKELEIRLKAYAKFLEEIG